MMMMIPLRMQMHRKVETLAPDVIPHITYGHSEAL